jgi:hypothetical protein
VIAALLAVRFQDAVDIRLGFHPLHLELKLAVTLNVERMKRFRYPLEAVDCRGKRGGAITSTTRQHGGHCSPRH